MQYIYIYFIIIIIIFHTKHAVSLFSLLQVKNAESRQCEILWGHPT